MLRGSPFAPGKVSHLSFSPSPCAGYRSLETLTSSKQNKFESVGSWLFHDLGSEAWPGTFTLRVDYRVDAPKRTLTLRKVTALKVEAVSGYRRKGLSNFSLTLSQNDWFREDNDSNGKEKLLFRVRTELHNSAK